jgi:D-3-phosphoglycerate dehydrogenase
MKTLITAPEYYDNDAVALFKTLGEVTVKKCTEKELLKIIPEYDILAIRVETKVTKAVIDAGKNLKIIATATTGTDHVDINYAKKKGIEVISLQGANTIATAEHALGMLLCIIRKIHAAHQSLISGKWNRAEFMGTQLHGKKLGIIGFGRIGKEIAVRAQACGMKILAYDPYLTDDIFTQNHAKKMQINELLQEADVVTLHVFLTDETRGFINKKVFEIMKKNAILINCSRGEVVNDNDLTEALEKKEIAGACLDVFAEEPLPEQNILVQYAKTHDNLLLTPHIAGSTYEAMHEAGIFVAQKTKEMLKQ